jgi:hypothetical protein
VFDVAVIQMLKRAIKTSGSFWKNGSHVIPFTGAGNSALLWALQG